MTDSFQKRLNFDGNIDEVIERAANNYSLGNLKHSELMTVGLQDYNLHIITNQGEYVIKVFSKLRNVENIRRYVEIIKAALNAGVHHPSMLKDMKGEFIHTDEPSGLSMIVLEYIRGKTFYDMDRAPNSKELKLIAAETVKINKIKFKPSYLFDSWAVPNIHWMYKQVNKFLDDEGKNLAKTALSWYEALPIKLLPTCFVQGDIIKTNVVLGENSQIYIIDFAVSNIYPRVQELAVMSSNLMDNKKAPLLRRVERVKQAYLAAGGELTEVELKSLYNYAVCAVAMEFMGSYHERYVIGETADEISYWMQLGRQGLKEGLGEK